MAVGPPLSFEDFLRKQNSFHMHFVGLPGLHMIGDIYRAQSAYQNCRLAEGETLTRLEAELHSLRVADHFDADFQQKLYQAYLLLRPYATDDAELFR